MTTRSRKQKAAKPDTSLVSVEIAQPFAVIWDGEQRTGTVDGVPLDTALEWLRRGWAAYCWGDNIPKMP
jgi:hypothetical protein